MTSPASPASSDSVAPVPSYARDAIARAQAGDLELVRFLYVDHDGVIRAKAAATQFMPERVASGIGHTVPIT